MEKGEKATQALAIVRKHSFCDGKVRLYNSMLYAEPDLDVCVPLLNELYETNVSIDEVRGANTVQEFLSHWDSEIDQHIAPEPEESDNETESHETGNTEVKIKKRYVVGWIIAGVYIIIVFLNKCTSYHNAMTEESEGVLYSALQILNTIDTIIDPSNWLFGIPQLFMSTTTWVCVVCLLIFGFYSIAYTWLFYLDKEQSVYFHQPVIAVLIVILGINNGYYGPLTFNLAWTCAVPLTYIVVTLLGIAFVHYSFKLFHPENKCFKAFLQISPLLIWLGIYLFVHYYF